MREIKFRVWFKLLKRMDYKSTTGGNVFLNDMFVNGENISVIYSQYTGLKDKNGVEIYEGDIIFWKDLSESSDGTLEDVVSVFFDDEHLRWGVETYGSVKAYESLYNYSNVDEIEVIGNIYENPELLEVKYES